MVTTIQATLISIIAIFILFTDLRQKEPFKEIVTDVIIYISLAVPLCILINSILGGN